MAARERSLRRRVLVLGLVSAVAPRLGLAGWRDDFGLLDANGDGAIDLAEFAGLAAVLGGDAGLRTPPGATPARSLDAAPDVAPGVEVGADGAYVDCPCIDHVNDTAWAAVVSGHVVGDGALVVGGKVLPRDYGSTSCRAWDAAASSFPGCTGLDRPNCHAAWCYVNISHCQRADASESLVFEGLHWSHFTCGEVGWSSNSSNISALLPIYAGDLTNRGHPTRAIQTPPVTLRSNLRAASMLAYEVAERVGLGPSTLQYRALSDASERVHSNPYTACVHDINIGNLDLCLGDWWFTAARSLMMVEFVPVFVEDMRLLVRKTDQAESMTVWDHLSRTFAPFSLGLWGVILGTLFVASILMAVVEGEGVCSVRGSDGGVPRGLATLSTSLYQMALSFASFSTMLNPVTPAGKVLGLATAFFLTFVGACFTANTVQFLLTEAKTVRQVGSLSEFFDAGKRVCFSSPMLPILMQIDARITQLGAQHDWDVLDLLRHGDCDGAIVSDFMVQDAWAVGDFCDYELVGSALHNYNVGFYTSVKLSHSVRHAVGSAMADGIWQSVRGVLEKHGAACPSSGDAAPNIPRQLHFTHMLGNNLIFVASCVVSLAMHCLGKGLRASSNASPIEAPAVKNEDGRDSSI